jgi:hypothetical protein
MGPRKHVEGAKYLSVVIHTPAGNKEILGYIDV